MQNVDQNTNGMAASTKVDVTISYWGISNRPYLQDAHSIQVWNIYYS